MALAAGALAGCASNITREEARIPKPLTEKLPVSVGLRMPENFYSFYHEEEVYGREVWSIDLGDANASLFQQLFGHMFAAVKVLDGSDDPGVANVDVLIEPSIDAFEFSVPAQSRTDSFAVWVRYRLKIYDREGQLVSNWPVSAYGKSQTQSVSNSEALQRAAVLAMRDAAALIIMKLDSATGISTLAERPAPEASPAEAPTTLGEETDASLQTTAIEEIPDEAG
jgi:hypothetical protein